LGDRVKFETGNLPGKALILCGERVKGKKDLVVFGGKGDKKKKQKTC